MEIITLHEVADILRYEGDGAEKKARKWLYKYGLKQFATGKYIREQFEELLEERGKRCLTSENVAKCTTSGERYEWGTRRLKSQKGLLDFAKQAMQKNTLAA